MIYISIFLIILSIIFIIIGYHLIKQSKKIKFTRTNEIKRLQQELNDKEKELLALQKQTDTCQFYISRSKQQLDTLHKQQEKLNNELKQREQQITNYYDVIENQAKNAFNQYENNLNQSYEQIQKKHSFKIKEIESEQNILKNRLEEIKKVYQAATDARIREQEQQEKLSFYKIKLTEKQISDITKLQEFKTQLYNPSLVSKVIWSSYIMKPTTDLCNRVLGNSSVCGIYKITNKTTEQIYIGQSINIADRWKQHIKCGLGIEASSTNKLYNNMQQTGVWNFTFELLEKCSKDQLNEKEKFWIEMYSSNKTGLNTKAGNK